MMRILFSLFALFLFLSCTSSKNYQYIENVEKVGVFGTTTIEEKDAVTISAPNDSAAYLQAYEKFCIAVKVNKDIFEAAGVSGDKPLNFRLLNEEGANVAASVSFASKEQAEQEIATRVFFLENSLLKSGEADGVDSKTAVVIDTLKIQELEKYFTKKRDEFDASGKTWYEPKSAPQYTNKNGIYCYFQTVNGVPGNLRFRIQYYADDWLFFNKVQFSIDDSAYEYVPSDTETDNGDGGMIWEWFDEKLTVSDRPLMTALANAKNAKMKFVGRQYYDIKTITPQQILDIKRTLELYNALGGNY